MKKSLFTLITLGLLTNFCSVKTYAQITVTVCANDANFTVLLDKQLLPAYMQEGGNEQPMQYSVIFNTVALPAGYSNFSNIINATFSDATPSECKITIPVPQQIRANIYTATIEIKNTVNNCTVNYDIIISVLYPKTVIKQKCNDALSVVNAGYNGGYTFSSYQWYKNGVAITGATYAILYETLDFTAEYTVLVTRSDDGIILFTCPIIPVYKPAFDPDCMGVWQ